ncbi:hypothetical protein ACPW96_21130 [Micromonospora sp. DT81.3]|uniref:hypothetical protein n=1 Tax=Micromonospora sp. DT81.3 TaxID=3416523 RepID=UPI003CFB84C4
MKTYERHAEDTVRIAGSLETVFAVVDDPMQISTHMSRRTWMMAGSTMTTQVDELGGHAVGSHIRMTGRVIGIPVGLDQAITLREPPLAKQWATQGTPKLIVIGPYAMAVELEPHGEATSMRVMLDYDLPAKNRWLGRLFGRFYANWCVRQVVHDVSAHFAEARPGLAGPSAASWSSARARKHEPA